MIKLDIDTVSSSVVYNLPLLPHSLALMHEDELYIAYLFPQIIEWAVP